MRIKPCHGCQFSDGCEHRAVFRGKLRGLGARSVTFACPRLDADMRVGRRVRVRVKMIGSDWEPYYGDCRRPKVHEVNATILSVGSGYHFSALIDEDAFDTEEWADFREGAHTPDAIRFRRSAPHTRIVRFLDEPDAPACQYGQIAGTCVGDCICHPEGGGRP